MTPNISSPAGGSTRASPLPAGNRFVVLLAALALLLVSVPFVGALRPAGRPLFSLVLVTGVFTLMLISAVFAVSDRRRTAIVALALAGPAILLQILNLFLLSSAVEIAQDVLGIIFLAFVIVLILRHLFSTKRVTVDTICASLCAYILLGVLWAIGYSLMEMIHPDSFAFPLADEAEAAAMHFGHQYTVFALYYSFVTMTTLGYGDIVPATGPARMLAATQALTGQLYLAVLVARLVAMHIIHSSQPPDE